MGAALADTSGEIATGVGIAISGVILAATFHGQLAAGTWTSQQAIQFRDAVTWAGITLTVIAATLVGWGIKRARQGDMADDPRQP